MWSGAKETRYLVTRMVINNACCHGLPSNTLDMLQQGHSILYSWLFLPDPLVKFQMPIYCLFLR